MRVRYSNLALVELDTILAHVRAENSRAASNFEARVRRVIERIAQFPEAAQEVAERPGVRRVPLVRYPYVIHDTVGDDEVVILRIIHGARRSPWD
jgi:toxin ParE1/3/4